MMDCTMDGAFYYDLMEKKVFPAVEKYYGKFSPSAQVQRAGERAKRVTNQEDGAGGHGLGRGESQEHKALVEMGKRLGIDTVTQSSSSPELNALDLGFWWALDSRVCQRYKEFNAWTDKDTLYDLLFSVIEEEFWALDPD